MFSDKRDEPAARAFFTKAIGSNGIPEKVTIDKSGANKAGMNTINIRLALLFILGDISVQILVRQVKYLNNIVEQDHRFVKKITRPIICYAKGSICNQKKRLSLNNSMDSLHKCI